MLRRHIRRSATGDERCSGLDADAASAYLEGALEGPSLVVFQSHLADCHGCRRQLIELSRIAVQPRPAVPPPSLWERLRSSLADAVGSIQGARWDWPVAGAAAAVCAVLVLTLLVRPWRQDPSSSVQPVSDVAVNDVRAAETAESQEAPLAQPEEPASPISRSIPRPRIDSPAIIPLSTGIGDLAVSTARLTPAQSTESIRPPLVPRPIEEFIPTRSSAQGTSASSIAYTESRQTAVADEIERPELAPRINPLPDYNPMHSVSTSDRRSAARTRSDRNPIPSARPGWTGRVMGFMPVTRPEPRRSVEEPEDEEIPRQLVHRMRDKVFRYENGTWIDMDYKPEKMYWRITRIERGTREYERLVADEPQIREFLNLDQLILVWRDKIYRIVKR